MTDYGPIGKNLCNFEEPDIIYMRLTGAISAEEGMEVNRRHREFGRGRDILFFLVDIEGLETIHPEVRKEAGSFLKDLPMRGAAFYKASLKAKVTAKLILTAVNLFRPAHDKIPVCFFADEEEARAWIVQRRREVHAEAAGGAGAAAAAG